MIISNTFYFIFNKEYQIKWLDYTMQAFNQFYYISGRFSTQKYPHVYCKRYIGVKPHALVSTHFLCVLDIDLEGDYQISKNAMAEFYHNLSMQTLSKSNYEVGLDFTKTSELIKSINISLQERIQNHKRNKNQRLKTAKYLIKMMLSQMKSLNWINKWNKIRQKSDLKSDFSVMNFVAKR